MGIGQEAEQGAVTDGIREDPSVANSCFECGKYAPRVLDGNPVCVMCSVAWRELRSAGWNPDAICKGWTAFDWAMWITERKGISKTEARMRVIEKFPDQFSGGSLAEGTPYK